MKYDTNPVEQYEAAAVHQEMAEIRMPTSNFENHQSEEPQTRENNFLGRVKQCLRWICQPFRSKYSLGVIFIICVAIIWVGSSVWIQYIFGELDFDRPFFLTYFNTTLFSLYNFGYLFKPSWRRIPWTYPPDDAADRERASSSEVIRSSHSQLKGMKESSRSAFVEAEEERVPSSRASFVQGGAVPPNNVNAERESILIPFKDSVHPHPFEGASGNPAASPVVGEPCIPHEVKRPYSMYKIWHCATFFCFYWFAANYLFNLSLSKTTVSSNTVLSSTSNIWTLLFSHLILHQRVGILKCLAVALCVGGCLFITLFDNKASTESSSSGVSLAGDAMALVSSFFYAVYTSVLSKCLPDDERYSMPMVFGAVGVINLLCFWPGIIALNETGYEKFTLPNGLQFGSLLLNSLIGTNLADILWARSVVLSSPVVATLGLSLTSPISMVADAVFKGTSFHPYYICGAIMVMVGFVLVSVPKFDFKWFKKHILRRS